MKLMVGTDIESVNRFDKFFCKHNKLLKKLFFESEINYALKKGNKSQSLAGIWCAKESIIKAFSQITSINISDIEIVCKKNCAPKILIHDSMVNNYIFQLSLSISHTKEYATAVCILFTNNKQK